MKAVRLVEWKHAPEVVDVDEPTPGAGEVLVRIGGAGICHTDISLIHVLEAGMLPFEPPFTLGHENAGWVAQLGDGVRGFEVGSTGGGLRPVGLRPVPQLRRRRREPLRTARRRRGRGRWPRPRTAGWRR